MSTSFAELNSRLFMELEAAAEFLQLDKIHNAIVQVHNIRAMQSRFSSVNVLLALSEEFTPTEVVHDITTLINQGVPQWIEVESDTDEWIPIRVVPLVSLQDYRIIGTMAAAFEGLDQSYKGDDEGVTQNIHFSYLPSGACRIRFEADHERTALSGNMVLPDHLADLIIKEAEQQIIPRIKLAMGMRMRRDEELKSILDVVLGALNEIYAQNERDILNLLSLWKVWAFRNRSTSPNFTKPTPSGRNFYGGRDMPESIY